MADNSDFDDGHLKEGSDALAPREPESQDQRIGFNWLLPLLGAIGFGAGFAFRCAISVTSLDLAKNTFAALNPEGAVGIEAGLVRGLIVGAMGGAALGYAFKDKKQAIYFALTGAVGFALAFAVVLAVGSYGIGDLGRAMIKAMGGPDMLSSFETGLAHGLGAGAIVGAIGGLVLGLGSPKGRFFSAPLLGLVGLVWFANAFALEAGGYAGACNRWDGTGGAVGGAAFGLTLAIYYVIHDRVRLWRR